jgi:hypothetical protein
MKLIRFIQALACIAALGSTVTVTVSCTKDAAGVGTVTGTVTDADTGAPLAGVTVKALTASWSDAIATTGSDGQYTVASVTMENHAVIFSRDGYLTASVTVKTADFDANRQFAIDVQLTKDGQSPSIVDKPAVGKWLFDDTDYGKAEAGSDLEAVGNDMLAVAGPSETNKAVKIGVGSYFKANHGIEANGGGAKVNEYTLLIDFKVDQTGRYYAFLQTDPTNTSDGEIFINGDAKIGISGGYYSEPAVETNTWYRYVVTVKCGELWKQYLNGKLLNEAASDHDEKMNVDGRFALDPAGVLLFADEDGEDNEIIVAATAIYDYALSADEVAALGKVSDPIE